MTTTRSIMKMNDSSPLAKHVQRFTDDESTYSPETVAAGLEKIHGYAASMKGYAISLFNATHSSDNIMCPVTRARFVKDNEKGYAKNLHLGTTRIWNQDGSLNEERWQKFIENTVIEYKSEKIVPKSKLDAYLSQCYYNDPQDLTTGRNSNALFSSKYIQGTAATAAWNEVYERLTCGWIEVDNNANQLEPYITLIVLREFFEDSSKAFQHAEDGLLPIARPQKGV